ncbi:MAG: hypothetical protein L0154_30795 [Chloroflexi bacterium]|nr:hypothetical protein [Chloroflexota bacterium]
MKHIVFVLIAFFLATSLLVAAAVASTPTSTAPFQTFPTATLLPVDDLEFAVELLEPSDEPVMFDDIEVDGYVFSVITYQTRYPRGLEFTFKVTPPEGVDLQSVNVKHEFAGGDRGRTQAQQIDEEGTWQAIPFERGGLPPWQVLDVTFTAAGGDGSGVETEPITVQYNDPTRPWWRGESADATIYWFDFPQELGDIVLKQVASVQDKYEKGFGGRLPYVPRVIIFPPGEAWGEFRTGGIGNDRTTGQANGSQQWAILRVRTLDIEDIRKDCIWNEPRDLNWQMSFAASVTTHEIAHLYQYEFFTTQGPAWWIEGQATFFESDSGNFDERIKAIARHEDLSSLQGTGPSGMVGTPAFDGCTHLGYEMGTSFINWWVNSYGGFEAHSEVVELMSRNISLADALEQISGVSFVELEKQWRAYVGLNPEPNFIPTPTFFNPLLVTPTQSAGSEN